MVWFFDFFYFGEDYLYRYFPDYLSLFLDFVTGYAILKSDIGLTYFLTWQRSFRIGYPG